jgi:uncharacterized protein YoxC
MAPNEWPVVWLAVAAISLALMALTHVGGAIALAMVAREALKTLRGVQAQVAPLVDRGHVLMAKASDVVDHAKVVVSGAGVQVDRVAGAVSETSQKVAHLRASLLPVTANISGLAAGVRTFWSVVRGDGRRQDYRGPDLKGERDIRDVMPATSHGSVTSL